MVYLEDDKHLPPPVDLAAVPTAPEATGPVAPANTIVPPRMPSLPSGKPAAVQIMSEFEECVVVKGGPMVGTYSPLRLWTRDDRKPHPQLMAQSSSFNRRAHIYLYLLHQESLGVDVAGLPDLQNELNDKTKEWRNSKSKEDKNAVNWEKAARVATAREAARHARPGIADLAEAAAAIS